MAFPSSVLAGCDGLVSATEKRLSTDKGLTWILAEARVLDGGCQMLEEAEAACLGIFVQFIYMKQQCFLLETEIT